MNRFSMLILCLFLTIFMLFPEPAQAGLFGSSSTAGISNGGLANAASATKYTLSENGIVVSLSMYCYQAGGNVKMGIYANSGGNPTTLIVANNTSTVCTAGNWVTLPVSPTFLTAGIYWVASIQSAGNMMAWRAGGTNQFAYNVGGNFTTGLVSPFPAISNQSNDYIMYASYATYARVTVRQNTVVRRKTIIR